MLSILEPALHASQQDTFTSQPWVFPVRYVFSFSQKATLYTNTVLWVCLNCGLTATFWGLVF